MNLPLLRAEDLLKYLPGVLYDLVLFRDRFFAEDGEFVVYFLDVIGESPEEDARRHDELTRFAEEFDGPAEMREQLRECTELAFRELPRVPPFDAMSAEELRAHDRAEREEYFATLTPAQSCAVYRWLLVARGWDGAEFCRPDIERALAYWRGRCEGTGAEGASVRGG